MGDRGKGRPSLQPIFNRGLVPGAHFFTYSHLQHINIKRCSAGVVSSTVRVQQSDYMLSPHANRRL